MIEQEDPPADYGPPPPEVTPNLPVSGIDFSRLPDMTGMVVIGKLASRDPQYMRIPRKYLLPCTNNFPSETKIDPKFLKELATQLGVRIERELIDIVKHGPV